MIRMPTAMLEAIRHHAGAAYPRECCGLVIGRDAPARQAAAGAVVVTEAVACRNVAPAPERTFEVDPQARFDVERRLRGTPLRVVGHYHSHPDGPARPSAHDVARMFEAHHVWVIVGVAGGKAGRPRAFVPDTGDAFGEIDLVATDEGNEPWA